MGNGAGEEALKTLMDTLASSDEGSLAAANQVMRQTDIDYLVSLLQELQKYKEIGTPEECAEYKRKALCWLIFLSCYNRIKMRGMR